MVKEHVSKLIESKNVTPYITYVIKWHNYIVYFFVDSCSTDVDSRYILKEAFLIFVYHSSMIMSVELQITIVNAPRFDDKLYKR